MASPTLKTTSSIVVVMIWHEFVDDRSDSPILFRILGSVAGAIRVVSYCQMVVSLAVSAMLS